MLSIGKLGRGQERYYLDKVAEGAEDYYAGEGEAPGEWLGDAARELGLQGDVDAEQLTAMLTGRNPLNSEPLLSMRGVRGDGAVPGFDLTFSAPKSVSLLWGLGGPVAALEVSPPTASPRRRPRLSAAPGLLDPARRRRRRVRQGQRLPRRRLPPSLLAKRRPPAPHPRPDRQRDQGAGRKVDEALPPGDLRTRDHGELHLRGPPAPRADSAPRDRVAAGAQGDRRDRGLRRRAPAGVLDPPGGNPRGGRAGCLGALDAGGDAGDAQAKEESTSRRGRAA